MIVLVPIAIGVVCGFILKGATESHRPTCTLTSEERNALDFVLTMSNEELVSAGAAAGVNTAMVVADLHKAAAHLISRGCPDDARRLRIRATDIAVAALPPTDQGPPLLPPSVQPSLALPPPPAFASPGAPLTGAFVAATLGAPGAPGARPNWGADPAAYAPPPPSATSPPPAPPPIIARMRCGQRCWVRPEPRQWNDAWGRFGFSIPAGWSVGVVSFEPSGWARVTLAHPDHGRADGFVEVSQLVPDNGQPQGGPAMPAMPGMQGAATGNCPGGVCPVPQGGAQVGKGAMPQSAFMATQPTASQRSRKRNAKMKAKRAAQAARS